MSGHGSRRKDRPPQATSNGDAPEVPGAVTVYMTRNLVGVITSVDESIVAMLGWLPEQLVGLPSNGLVHPEDQASAIAAWITMISSPGTTRAWRGRYQAVDGTWTWVETMNHLEDP